MEKAKEEKQAARGNYLYVDKTEYLWELIRPTGESYLLSRPSQMGIFLLLSTLKAIFQGKKELFRRLAIYDKPYEVISKVFNSAGWKKEAEGSS